MRVTLNTFMRRVVEDYRLKNAIKNSRVVIASTKDSVLFMKPGYWLFGGVSDKNVIRVSRLSSIRPMGSPQNWSISSVSGDFFIEEIRLASPPSGMTGDTVIEIVLGDCVRRG